MRQCTKCEKDKEDDQFYIRQKRYHWCKTCSREYHREHKKRKRNEGILEGRRRAKKSNEYLLKLKIKEISNYEKQAIALAEKCRHQIGTNPVISLMMAQTHEFLRTA